jgi:hypothetical protein
MYMPTFQAKKLVKGVSDEIEVNDLQGTLSGRSRESASLTLTAMAVWDVRSTGSSRDCHLVL